MRDQVNASPIKKITSWFKFKFLGKKSPFGGLCKSEVMLTYIDMYFTYVSKYTRSVRWRIMLASEENADSMTFLPKTTLSNPVEQFEYSS